MFSELTQSDWLTASEGRGVSEGKTAIRSRVGRPRKTAGISKFIDATLRALRARLEGKDFLAGNWSLRELVDRLEQVGVMVSVENAQSSSVEK